MEYLALAIGLSAVKAVTLFAMAHVELVMGSVLVVAAVVGIGMLLGHGARVLKGSGQVVRAREGIPLGTLGVAVAGLILGSGLMIVVMMATGH